MQTDADRTQARQAAFDAMTSKGYGPSKLAQLTGVSRNTIRIFLDGKAWPHARTLSHLEAGLGLAPGTLSATRTGDTHRTTGTGATAVVNLDPAITDGLDPSDLQEIEATALAAALARVREIRGRTRR